MSKLPNVPSLDIPPLVISPSTSPSSPLARRIVTGRDEDAKSRILYDDDKGNVEVFPNGSTFQTVWFTDNVPIDCSSPIDPTGNKTFPICNDGSVCMVVSFAPGMRSPMHYTKSLDYGIILEGEVELLLDNGDIRVMKAGDIIVQRETMHAWYNRHPTQWSRAFFVLIASKGFEEDQQASE